MLDYLAKQNKKDEDYLITFDDEYFYAYLVWSLKDFLLELSYGLFQDETKLLLILQLIWMTQKYIIKI